LRLIYKDSVLSEIYNFQWSKYSVCSRTRKVQSRLSSTVFNLRVERWFGRFFHLVESMEVWKASLVSNKERMWWRMGSGKSESLSSSLFSIFVLGFVVILFVFGSGGRIIVTEEATWSETRTIEREARRRRRWWWWLGIRVQRIKD